MNNEDRIPEIKEQLTDNQEFIDSLCSLPEDRYRIVFEVMKLVKLLEMQTISDNDIKEAEVVCQTYGTQGINKIALMAYLYGKITGKEERVKD